jgi:hypothetical protein
MTGVSVDMLKSPSLTGINSNIPPMSLISTCVVTL